MAEDAMTLVKAETFTRDYVCATCWGSLMITTHKTGYSVRCRAHEEHSGLVTKTYADHRRSESLGELAEARYNLGEALGLVERRPEEEILRDLGF